MRPGPLALVLLFALPALADERPPFAAAPADAPTQAASPKTWDDLSTWSWRRLRLSGGFTFQHTPLRNPGGNAVGLGGTAILERRRDEFGLSVYASGGVSAEDPHGRNTGVSMTYLRGLYRYVPVVGSTRVLLEGGLQASRTSAYAFCRRDVAGTDDVCDFVPGRFGFGAVLGPVVHLQGRHNFVTLGADALVTFPRPPESVRASPVALQLWLETGIGGLPW